MLSRLSFDNMLTHIPQATICIIINARAFGQFAPGMGDRAKPISGRKLIKRKTKAII
jgi:hypothetical protein